MKNLLVKSCTVLSVLMASNLANAGSTVEMVEEAQRQKSFETQRAQEEKNFEVLVFDLEKKTRTKCFELGDLNYRSYLIGVDAKNSAEPLTYLKEAEEIDSKIEEVRLEIVAMSENVLSAVGKNFELNLISFLADKKRMVGAAMLSGKSTKKLEKELDLLENFTACVLSL